MNDWISEMTQKNYAMEITQKIGNILKPNTNNNQLNIAIDMNMQIPDYSITTLNNNSIIFSGLSVNYEKINGYSFVDIVEINCAETLKVKCISDIFFFKPLHIPLKKL